MKRPNKLATALIACGVAMCVAKTASAMTGGDPVTGTGYALMFGVDGGVVCNPGGMSDCP